MEWEIVEGLEEENPGKGEKDVEWVGSDGTFRFEGGVTAGGGENKKGVEMLGKAGVERDMWAGSVRSCG